MKKLTSKNATGRNQEIDILKGLGIIAVVVGHSGASFAPYLYMYHLALFFFASGFLFKENYAKNPFTYFGSRLKNLWFPFFIYNMCFVLLHNIFSFLNIYSQNASPSIKPLQISDYIYSFQTIITMQGTEPIGMAMWFIIPLFVGMNIFCLISYLTINIKPTLIKVIAYIFISLICYNLGAYLIDNKYMIQYFIDVALLVIPIICVGYLYKQFQNKFKIDFKINIILSIVLCIFSIYFLVKCKNEEGMVSLNIKYYISKVWFLIVSFSGIYLNVVLSKLIQKIKQLNNIFSYLGQNSFHIMALHLLMFKIAGLAICLITNKDTLYIANIAIIPKTEKYWLLYTIVGIIFSILCIKALTYLKNKIQNIINTTKVNQKCE